MRRFLLNSAVLTGPGTYSYRLVNAVEAKAWLNDLHAPVYESAIRYETTADAICLMLQESVETSHAYAKMDPGDEALVFRLKMSVERQKKASLTAGFVAENAEIGIMKRID